ncbi:MAG: CoA-transferase [Thermodesulfobacteriota bacterium]|nr:CoA-transferase [Thermodesulfobacteriota bacterium]
MHTKVNEIIQNVFHLKEEGEGKVIPLKDAIRQNVKPGMELYIGDSANSVIREIIRQFQGTDPRFILIMSLIIDDASDLIHCGLSKKVITGSCTEIFPTPAPIYSVRRAYKEGRIWIENWSLFSMIQRLMAGALGVGFMPIKSIMGSSMAEENQDSFRVIKDPFGESDHVGIVKALCPDLALIHGLVADRYGNTILAPNILTGQGVWGAMASKQGVVISVEKLVSSDFIREHSSHVSIPGHVVKSVSIVPLGAHPQARINPGIKDFDGYGADYEFMDEHRKAGKDPQALDTWIKEWVMDCKTHEEYLHKLGYERILFLKGKADKETWQYNLASVEDKISVHEDFNPIERMIIAAAGKIREVILKNGYKVMLAGIGASGLAAWVSYYSLKKEDYDIHLLTGSGLFDLVPRPADPQVASISHIPTCKMVTDALDSYGILVGGEKNQCISILGAGQIDKNGNINTTKVSQDVFLIGSGGSNDAVNSREQVVVMTQSRTRLIDQVPYITCPGAKVNTLISDKGIFEKLEGNELILTGYFPNSSQEEDIQAIRENCGWDLKVSPSVEKIASPALEELVTVRLLDPERYFIGE